MTELTTEQLIKIIIGALVFVAVVIGVYLFFRFRVIDFFKGYSDEEQPIGEQTGGTGGVTTPTQEIIDKVNRHCGYCSNIASLNFWRCLKEECENNLSPEVRTKLNINYMKCKFVDDKCIAAMI